MNIKWAGQLLLLIADLLRSVDNQGLSDGMVTRALETTFRRIANQLLKDK